MVLRRSEQSHDGFECGHQLRKQFQFDPAYLNLNHGSFGSVPKSISTSQDSFREAAEKRPDVFIRYTLPHLIDTARAAIANYIHAPEACCVFVPNATTGINTVLRNLRYTSGDVIIYFSTIYGACEKSILYISETTPARTHKIDLTYPLSTASITSAFLAAVSAIRAEGKTPKLCLFDTISSLPGLPFPYREITTLCRQQSILSLIDGAHSLGHTRLDLSDLDPDFFVSNAHKWLFVPRVCAVFYVPLRNQHLIRSTLPTSHGFVPAPGTGILNPLPLSEKSDFVNNFEYVGTLDCSAYCTVPAALEWRAKVWYKDLVGEEAIMAYCHQQAEQAGRLVAEVLGTEVLGSSEGTNFANVRLPLDWDRAGNMETAVKVGQWISETLVEECETFMAILIHDHKWWVRLSAQAYLTLEDWEKGACMLKGVGERAREVDWSHL